MITKCPCEHCGSNIEFEAEHAGTDIECPHCSAGTRLRIPSIQSSLRPCLDCGHNISRSALACPSCGRPQTKSPLIPRARAPKSESTFNVFGKLAAVIGAIAVIAFFYSQSASTSSESTSEKSGRLAPNVVLTHTSNMLFVENKEAQGLSVVTIYLNRNPLEGPSGTFKHQTLYIGSGETAEIPLREFAKESTGERFDPDRFKVTAAWVGANGFDYRGFGM